MNVTEFAKEICRHGFDGSDLSGAEIMAAAERHGLVKAMVYDPEKHPNVTGSEYLEPGDSIYIFADALSAAALPAAAERRAKEGEKCEHCGSDDSWCDWDFSAGESPCHRTPKASALHAYAKASKGKHCPICHGVEGCDHTVLERLRADLDGGVVKALREENERLEAKIESLEDHSATLNDMLIEASQEGTR